MVMSDYCKQRVLSLHWQGHKVSSIRERLVLEAEILVLKQGIRLFLKHYGERGTIARKSGSSFPPKISPAIKLIVEQAMREDDEMTVTELQAKLAAHGVYVSLATIVRGRHQLGWTYRGSAYCQLIRNAN